MTEEPRWTAWKAYLDALGLTGDLNTGIRQALRDELTFNIPRGRTSGVVWQYGGGVVKGAMEKLIHPRYAEETPDGTVLISDYEGNRVFEVAKDSLETIWEYPITQPNVAHRLADGSTIMTGVGTEIIQVNQAGTIIWRYQIPEATAIYDALKIDGEMVITYFTGPFATAVGHVRKINHATQATIWDANTGTPSRPTAIFHIIDQHGGRPSFAPGRDGDYLIGDSFFRLFELRDVDQAIVWQYGVPGERLHAHNRLGWTSMAVIGWSDINYSQMFIACADHGQIIAINRQTQKQWQYGWSPFPGSGLHNSSRGPLLNTPDSINFTEHGTMLIADSGGSKVIEILLTKPEVPREWAHLFWEEEIRDVLAHDSLVAETGWYPWRSKIITVENGLDQNVSVQVEGSRRANFTNVYPVGAPITVNTVSTQAIVISDPVQFLRIEVTAAVLPTSGSLTAIVEMFDDG